MEEINNIGGLSPEIGVFISGIGTFLIALFGMLIQGGTWVITFATYGAILVGIFAVISANYVFTGYVYSAMAKKLNVGCEGYAWIPVFQQGFAMYLIYQMTGKKRLVLFGKYVISNGGLAVALWIGVHYLGNAAVQVFVGQFAWVPVVGALVLALGNLLALIPVAAFTLLEYAYVRDLLNLFEADEKKNNVVAVIVAVVDALIPLGIAKTILLACYLKKEPLDKAE